MFLLLVLADDVVEKCMFGRISVWFSTSKLIFIVIGYIKEAVLDGRVGGVEMKRVRWFMPVIKGIKIIL